ncbi:ABC transporter substrate-binding protein [Methylovirgula sp. 4M-Z18]|uniref:ABC transporter substrate-binding protein n=1 Tax=Methylovirgula sp. 4M-Z18 TaxID=2293567 RepID=UPI000E2F55DD|nr:ABC transporter substrate-binding protein [Methylovirgula sp. 4M-Z18]RFB78822.1 ABC transporter substrate-binding protein [Methylovirgula sp. 4M-Z18]
MQVTRRELMAFAATAALVTQAKADSATEIDFFFPVPVQGALATQMQKLIARFNSEHPNINVTAAYTGSYDDTNLKTRTAIKSGKPPALALMSANFVREYAINGEAEPFDDLIAAQNTTTDAYFDRFWSPLKPNAVIDAHVYGLPFQNSTPLLYYNTDAFKDAGLDPDHPPADWSEWLDAAKKLTKPDGSRVGLMFPGTYDYCGWLTSGLTMANGGEYYNHSYGGEVFYNCPSTIGALSFLDALVNGAKAMPAGVSDTNACTTAFFAGKVGMIVLSTGSLSFIRNNMKLPYKVAFLPKGLRHAAPIGGGSLIMPKGNSPERRQAAWTLAQWLTSPEVSGEWSRFTGYFAPNKQAYDLPDMQSFLKDHPDAKVALDQLAYAVPWFDTFNVVAVRKAMEDQIQAILNGKVKPADAAAKAQAAADELLRPYVTQTALRPWS